MQADQTVMAQSRKPYQRKFEDEQDATGIVTGSENISSAKRLGQRYKDQPVPAPRKQHRATSPMTDFIFALILVALLGIIVWDMRTVQEMSVLIHDDHTDLWEQMNATVMSQYLTPLDLCMLQINASDSDLHEHRAKNCSRHKSVGSHTSQKLFCNIGSSLGKQCYPPLATRTFFTSKLKEEHIGNPLGRYINTVAKDLAYKNKTLVFVGEKCKTERSHKTCCLSTQL